MSPPVLNQLLRVMTAEEEADELLASLAIEEPQFDSLLLQFAVEDMEEAGRVVPGSDLFVFEDYVYDFAGCERVFRDEVVVANSNAQRPDVPHFGEGTRKVPMDMNVFNSMSRA